MEKSIWVIGDNREEIINAQRCINASGNVRAVCILSRAALLRSLDTLNVIPSLIIIDYEMAVEDGFEFWDRIKEKDELTEIPLFFMANNPKEVERDDVVAVLEKPITIADVSRMEHMMWQFEVVRQAGKMLEKQAVDIAAAREIRRLNEQLKARNDLLYKVFGRYFSDEVMERILDDPKGALIGGDKTDMTVMMTDLRGFTAMSQSMDADEMLNLLNYYFARMVEVIEEYSGTVIEFLGDGILAVFGAPIEIDNHSEKAIAAAIVMQNKMKEINDYCMRHGYETLNMGIGIHRGIAFIGNIGSEKVMRYNVIGRVVNECSRIESYSVGGQVLVSDSTWKGLLCEYRLGEAIEVKAKGVKNPIGVHEVMAIAGESNVQLQSDEDIQLCQMNEDIFFELYPVADKHISEQVIVAKAKAVSYRIALLMYEGKDEIATYSDYKLVAKNLAGEILFSEVYGKVVSREECLIQLQFTYINSSFRHSIKQWLQEGGKTMIENDKYSISYVEDGKQIKVQLCSKTEEIRAIEFLDYMMQEFALVKGDKTNATATISQSILKSSVLTSGFANIDEYLASRCRDYFEQVKVIVAGKFVKQNEEIIETMPLYTKKKVKWAYVKSTDVLEEGKEFVIKSLENEAGKTITANENVYIMIGCRGEIYDITKEKFMNTYVPSEEALDVFEQMLTFIPEIKEAQTDEYIVIDEVAKVCYPKQGNLIYAMPLSERTKVFEGDGKGDYFLGHVGDYMVIREDDVRDIYVIKKDIFEETYVRYEDE